jgi:hypothetical protein
MLQSNRETVLKCNRKMEKGQIVRIGSLEEIFRLIHSEHLEKAMMDVLRM